MKRAIAIFMAVLTCLVITSSVVTTTAFDGNAICSTGDLNTTSVKVPKEAVWKKVLSMPYGSGIGEVGLFKDEIAVGGPNVIIVEGNNISILDTYNNRILIYNTIDGFSSIGLPDYLTPLNMCRANGSYYVLDTMDTIYEVKESEKAECKYELPEGFSSGYIDKLQPTADGGVEILDVYYSANVPIISKEKGVMLKNSSQYAFVDGNSATIKDGDLTWNINLPEGRCGIYYIGKDKDGNAYVRVSQYVPDSAVVMFEPTIRKFNKYSEQIGVALIPSNDWIFCADRYACVTEEGKLYVIGFTDSEATVYELILGSEYISNMTELTNRARQIEGSIASSSTRGQTFNVTRGQEYDNAVAMVGTQWTPFPACKSL